ncbi:DNA-binding TFAR19-related protein [Periconia macrospinosa]|uniref:DNA-binding TFAR19-related protein n=1 Tax=Periconia macrospinosa TaxID=97972 RepID=A0A2V1E7C4_9PLEO|nr:DNA-binding TFAR19-related protein [Periconia macrospinosa]
MADADLEEIRKARLAQLRQQSSASPSQNPSGASDQESSRAQREAEQRAAILQQILTPDAADRLGRIRMVKESRATDVENRLIMLARTNQLRAKVTEDQLKDLLGAVAEQQEKEESRIVVNRRGGGGLDDDDDLEDLLKDV